MHNVKKFLKWRIKMRKIIIRQPGPKPSTWKIWMVSIFYTNLVSTIRIWKFFLPATSRSGYRGKKPKFWILFQDIWKPTVHFVKIYSILIDYMKMRSEKKKAHQNRSTDSRVIRWKLTPIKGKKRWNSSASLYWTQEKLAELAVFCRLWASVFSG